MSDASAGDIQGVPVSVVHVNLPNNSVQSLIQNQLQTANGQTIQVRRETSYYVFRCYLLLFYLLFFILVLFICFIYAVSANNRRCSLPSFTVLLETVKCG